ncbi:MAG: 4-hydroxy-3-methylbut-2-enyl diphosphate reductase, partial [Rhodospirillaceae bacterium]|nr:4-hydroxy-3-methylbut-2-enyl diphosphate reductase [Rhodospirillaceae bacterium]
VETVDDAEALAPENPDNLAFVTQTTLSVDDTAEVIDVLKRRFPNIASPRKEDICYATTNRQAAVKAIAARCDMMVVIGAPNSSNSKRLVEVAQKTGCEAATLVQRANEIPWGDLAANETLGITAGASAPEVLVEEAIAAARTHFDVTVEEIKVADENVVFSLPRALSA